MNTVDGGGKIEPKILVVEDEEDEEESLGPKRWSKFLDEEEPPDSCLLFSMLKLSAKQS